MRVREILVIASLSLLDSACSDVYGYVPRDMVNKFGTLAIIDAGVIVSTDKTLADHLVSYQTGKNCSTVRTEQGRTYCVEDEPNPVATVHCYPTLGDVTCYAEPEPARNLEERVGFAR